MPAARSRSGRAHALDVLRPDSRYDVAFRLEENHWNGTVAPQLVVRRASRLPRAIESCASGSQRSGANRPPPATRKRLPSSRSSRLEDGARRDLLESARFRALLAQEPPLAKAA